MKIAFTADVHVGNHKRHGGDVEAGLNRRCRDVLLALERAVSLAVTNDGPIVICGDLFDTSRPSPQMIARVQEILEPAQAIVLAGNHDMDSTAPGHNALAPLAPVANVIERPRVLELDGADLFCVPFLPGPAVQWMGDVLADLAAKATPGRLRLLAFHLGVEDKHTPSYLRGAHDSIKINTLTRWMQAHSITMAFCGNWHERRVWHGLEHSMVVQCGALAPTGWDNPGADAYGMVTVLDPETRDLKIKRVPGPRFLDLHDLPTDKHEHEIMRLFDAKNTVYARWTVAPDQMTEALDALGSWRERQIIAAGEVRTVDEAAEQAAREAAMLARQAETLAEALAGFVAAMPLEEGIDRAEVLARAQALLGG